MAELSPRSDVDVIAALRIAKESTEDWEKFGKVAAVILEEAQETPPGNTGGVDLLLVLQRTGALRFDLDGDPDA